AAGTSVISYTVTTNNCSTISTQTITVNALPVVAAITGAFNVCAGSNTTLSNTTVGGVWSSASTNIATIDASGMVTGIAAGTSVISYTVTTNNCSTTSTQTITVNALPVVAAITGTFNVCAGSNTTLSNTTVGGVWSSASTNIASIDASGMVTGLTAGTSLISYNVTSNGCSSTATQTVTILSQQLAPVVTNKAFCLGDATGMLKAAGNGNNSVIWYGSNAIGGISSATAPSPITNKVGSVDYYVSQQNSVTGCESKRAKLTVIINPIPEKPIITRDISGSLFSSSITGNQWYVNGNVLIGDTLQKLKADQFANYSTKLNQNGCFGPMSDPYFNFDVVVRNTNINEFARVYPNPVQSWIKIDFTFADNIQIDVRILDLSGRVVTEKRKLETGALINVAGLMRGLYGYELVGKNGRILFSAMFMKD
ncbi:MAG: T9SS type A sorting domain-containing protein, partial [Bacteroidota bacterium]